MGTNPTNPLFRFGVFEADGQTEELRKQGRRLSLQGQPLQVLFMLLSRPGELVTRMEIQQRIWPEGTFVDFDHGLNTAINKIRDTLGDSAANPRFVETLARRGYRFVAPVEVIDRSAPPTPGAQPGAEEGVKDVQRKDVRKEEQPRSSRLAPQPSQHHAETPKQPTLAPKRGLLTTPDELPHASRPLVRSLFFLIQLMYLCFYLISLARLGVAEEIIRGMLQHALWAVALLVVTAAVGIPTRLYLISAVGFDAPGLREKFLRLFPVIFLADELWALAPFLLVHQIGYGLALGTTAALLYVPFAQRSLILMGAGAPTLKLSGS
jgi:cholera toxin transcriptional activator